MEKQKRKHLETEIDQWLDSLAPLETNYAPVGFVGRVMAAAGKETQTRSMKVPHGSHFWQVTAAGIALLIGLNVYTLHTIKETGAEDEQSTSYLIFDEQSADADTYGNYSQLAYERTNN
ncbi:MAG: hypothetical protein QM786_12680 [Breznakibacter sp.]